MSAALERWTKKDETNLKEIMGDDGPNGLPVGGGHPPNVPSVHLRVHPMDVPEFPDDLSTIANDTLGNDSAPRTPDKVPSKEGKHHVHGKRTHPRTTDRKDDHDKDDDDDETQPETPPSKHHKQSSRQEQAAPSGSKAPKTSRRFCRLLFISGCFGIILLGAIAVMALTLYRLRNDGTLDSADEDVTTAELGRSPPPFDFGPETIEVTSITTAAPTDPTTLPPGGNEVDENDPDEGETGPGEVVDESTIDSIRSTVMSTAADFYSDPARNITLDSNASLSYQVLEWMSNDPMLSSYPPGRIVQRYALGMIYGTLAGSMGVDSVTTEMDGWMEYSDECQWPLSRSNSRLCDGTGNVTSLYLEDRNFPGMLAAEMGLLTHLKLISLTSNQIQGSLPTELGYLTTLERLNLPRNELTGTIPTELGLLSTLAVLGLGNNMLDGPIPSEIGMIEGLGALQVHNNDLTGTIPDELWILPRLTTLQLENNALQGPLFSDVGLNVSNVSNLAELSLQGNELTGELPPDMCLTLESATVDCDMIQCFCCDGCDGSFFDEPLNETMVPTEETTLEPDGGTVPPSTEGTLGDGDGTLDPTAVSPTECQGVTAARGCFLVGEPIDIETFNCDPTDAGRLAMYRTRDLEESGISNPIFWVDACLSNQCDAVMADGFLFHDDGRTEQIELAPWPLEPDEYMLLMFQILEPGVVTILAESPLFHVADVC